MLVSLFGVGEGDDRRGFALPQVPVPGRLHHGHADFDQRGCHRSQEMNHRVATEHRFSGEPRTRQARFERARSNKITYFPYEFGLLVGERRRPKRLGVSATAHRDHPLPPQPQLMPAFGGQRHGQSRCTHIGQAHVRSRRYDVQLPDQAGVELGEESLFLAARDPDARCRQDLACRFREGTGERSQAQRLACLRAPGGDAVRRLADEHRVLDVDWRAVDLHHGLQ
ncbi:hypothetical protein [Actinoplanes oblitus]|uniref:hypothetical protein n=1 Tax=Actinoplanes oblitus TaxID=3040509 RepID=UPI00389926E1